MQYDEPHTPCLDCLKNDPLCLQLRCPDFFPPPPPLIPPNPPSFHSEIGGVGGSGGGGGMGVDRHPAVLIVGAALAGVLVLSLVAIFFLYFTHWRRRTIASRNVADVAGAVDEDEASDPAETHHVWFIRTVGLDEATISSICVAEYHKGAGIVGAAGGDCVVCVGEFCDGELIRIMPKCGHVFHMDCIDTWLRAHASCPLCRSAVVDPTAQAAGSGVNDSVVEEIVGNSVSVIDGDIADESSLLDNRNETAYVVQELSNTGSDNVLLRVRRSDSMELPSSGMHNIFPPAREGDVVEAKEESIRDTVENHKNEEASCSSLTQTGNQGYGRSFSSSGRFSFLGRNGRKSNSVLPL